MKKFTKYLGVTLLEVMLVLAIAAMIIVMSVRYYQSASANNQVNGALSMVQAIGAAADGLAQGAGGSYEVGDASTSNIRALMPNNLMTSPWGGAVTVTPADTSYTMNFAETPNVVCIQVSSRLAGGSGAESRYSVDGCGTGTGVSAMSIVYTNQ